MIAQMTKSERRSRSLAAVIIGGLLFIVILMSPAVSEAQGHRGPGVGGFLDEDGDGFNDLMPDRDGDGVPDALDPDFRRHGPDSAFAHQHRNAMPDSSRGPRFMMGDRFMMGPHGEPGMFGPGDSTRHRGMWGGDSMGGGMDPGDTSGHHGGGGMDPDSMGGHGGHGPGPGIIGPDKDPFKILDGKSGSTEQRSPGSIIMENKSGEKHQTPGR